MVVSAEARAYRSQVWLMNKGNKLLAGDVHVTINVYRPRKAGDLNNRLDVLFDALEGVAYVDDKQIVSIRALRFDLKENPGVDVWVEAMTPGWERAESHGLGDAR